MIEPQKNLEATERINENGRFLFLLNHGEEEIPVKLDRTGKELISGKEYMSGEEVVLSKKDVKIIWTR